MKSRAFSLLSSVTLLGLVLILFKGETLQAGEFLRYSCSAQVYQAFEHERLNLFTKTTGIPVQLKVSSSYAAVYRLINGFSDVASTAERLGRLHQDAGFVETPFCKDPLAVIAHVQSTVGNLSKSQLLAIFRGDITNWKELGGRDREIIRIVPGKETAAYKNFTRNVMHGHEIHYDIMTSRSTMAIEATRHFPGSISFIAHGATRDYREGVKLLRLDGLGPGDKGYPYFQIFSFVTRGEPTGAAKVFIDFARSAGGKKIILERGMLPFSKFED